MSNWDAIVRTHGPTVFGAAWRILGHAADTEDVVQEVFLEAHRLNHTTTVHNWAALLRRLAAYRALDKLRQRRTFLPLDDVNLASAQADPETAAIGHELAERLRQAIAQLPRREGEVFCLRYFEDLSYDDIADHLRISRGAVAAALHKARTKLQAMLSEVVQGG